MKMEIYNQFRIIIIKDRETFKFTFMDTKEVDMKIVNQFNQISLRVLTISKAYCLILKKEKGIN